MLLTALLVFGSVDYNVLSVAAEESVKAGTADTEENEEAAAEENEEADAEENVKADAEENVKAAAEENEEADVEENVEEHAEAAAKSNVAVVQADSDTSVSNAAISSWSDLKNAFQTGGEFTLSGDVTSTDSTYRDVLEIPAGITVTLDLAGHTIDRNLTTAISDGQVMKVNGTLIVNDSAGGGVITGGYGSGILVNAAAVCVKTGGSFTLNGGSISGNKTSSDSKGTGVAVDNNATFIMNGGSICNNTGLGSSSLGGGVGAESNATVKLLGGRIENNSVSGSYGGGLFFYGGNVTVGGSIVIKGNTAKGGITSNVASSTGSPSGPSLLLSEDMPLEEGAEIGWTLNTWNRAAVTEGTPVAKGKNVADYVDNFFPDQDPTYIIGVKADDAATIYIATADSTVVTNPGASPVERHTHDGKTFVPWSADSIKDNGNYTSTAIEGNYYLTDDVTLNTEITISSVTVDICLNGHTFDLNGKAFFLDAGATLNIYDCDASETTGKIVNGGGHNAAGSQKGGAVYVKGSTLNLYGGSLEENRAVWGGAVFIDATSAKSTVNMYGGTIQKNTAQYGGGGIEVENEPTYNNGYTGSFFNMYGGSIIDNEVTEAHSGVHKGGGVHFNQAGMMISGKVNISGNTVAGVENNVYLRNDRTITIDFIDEGSKIGVSANEIETSTGRQSNVITSGYGMKISKSDVKYFFLDGIHPKSKYALIHNGTELQIEKHTHAWKYAAGTGDNADKLYAYCETTTSHCEYFGETSTALPLSITAQSPFIYSGSAYDGAELSADELIAFNTATGNELSDADIVYYTKEDLSEKTTTANGAAADGEAPVNVGTYYAAVKLGSVAAKAEFTIEKASVTVTEPIGLTKEFNNTAQELITAGSVNHLSTTVSAGTMQYQVAADGSNLQDSGWSEDIPTAASVGKYRVYYRAVTDGNHTEVDYPTGYPYVQAEITKESPIYTVPAAVSPLTYNGDPQKLITAGETTHGTISYRLEGESWTTDASEITGTSAGEYIVYWKLDGNDSHADVPEQAVSVTIQKAEPSVGAAGECIIMSGNPLSSNSGFEGYTMKGVDGNDLPGTFGWQDGTVVPATDGTQTAVFRPVDTTNYKETTIQATVKVYYLPSGRITVKDSSWDKLLSVISFGIYHAQEQEVIIQATKHPTAGYDVDKLYYYIDTTGNTGVLSATELEGRWLEYDNGSRPKVKAQSKNVIYAKITDVGGNEAIICSDGIIIDNQAPVAALTINGNAYTTTDNSGFKGTADLNITITDLGDAGLESAVASYKKVGDTAGTDIPLTAGAGAYDISMPGEYLLTLEAQDHAGNVMGPQEYQFTVIQAHTITLNNATAKDAVTGQPGSRYVKDEKVIITADKPEEGSVFDHWETTGIELDDEQKNVSVITITMPDNDITMKAVYKDVTAPVISGITNGGKYCTSVTVTVTDRNLDQVTLDGTAVTLTNNQFTIPADGGRHTVKATDIAGNETECTVTVYAGHDFANPVYKETGRNGNIITEEAFCGHGCGSKIVRKRTVKGNDIISQEYPNDNGSSGSLATEVKVAPGAPAVSVAGLNIEVAKAFLDPVTELPRVENGETLLVYLKINRMAESDIPREDKTKTEEKAAAIKNIKQGVYLDLSMWKKIGTADDVQLMNAQTAEKLKITVSLPQELKAPSGKVRTYYVIRVHNGVADLLPTKSGNGQISFETDSFSTYSIWYTEAKASTPPSGDDASGTTGSQDTTGSQGTSGTQGAAGNQGTAGNPGNSNADTPKTGDESNMALWCTMLLLSAVVLAGIAAKRKKDRGAFHD